MKKVLPSISFFFYLYSFVFFFPQRFCKGGFFFFSSLKFSPFFFLSFSMLLFHSLSCRGATAGFRCTWLIVVPYLPSMYIQAGAEGPMSKQYITIRGLFIDWLLMLSSPRRFINEWSQIFSFSGRVSSHR